MKQLLFLCVIFPIVICQTGDKKLCESVGNFDPCREIPTEFKCENNSRCYCNDATPFCRCNNLQDTWYIGGKCDQKWTVITFALVASLPGLVLSILVGVSVWATYIFMNSKKKTESSTKNLESNQMSPQVNQSESMKGPDYTNLVFASDLQNRPIPTVKPSQSRIPMTSPVNSPHSPPQNGMQPFDRPYMANSANQPYSYATGMTQPARSPSVKTPYEERVPPSDRYADMQSYHTPPGHNMKRGGTSVYPEVRSPPMFQPVPEYGPRSQIPRAQMGRPY